MYNIKYAIMEYCQTKVDTKSDAWHFTETLKELYGKNVIIVSVEEIDEKEEKDERSI